MPTPRAIADYPAEYFALFERVIRGGLVSLKFATRSEAVRRRAHLYAFRTALFTTPEFAPAITLGAPRIQFTITARTLTLTLKSKGRPDDTPIRPLNPPTVS